MRDRRILSFDGPRRLLKGSLGRVWEFPAHGPEGVPKHSAGIPGIGVSFGARERSENGGQVALERASTPLPHSQAAAPARSMNVRIRNLAGPRSFGSGEGRGGARTGAS